MRRRAFIAGVAGAAAGSPLAARGQQKATPLVGYLSVQMRPNPLKELVVAELARLGWVEGKTITYDARDASTDLSEFPALAAELANRSLTLILAPSPPAAAAAQHATRTIPIITLADDMKASGFVSNIARPGGNITGVSIFASELDVKRLTLLSELVPTARRIAVLTESKASASMARLDAAARELRIELVVVEARNGGEIVPALDTIAASRIEAVNVLASVVLHGSRHEITTRMEAARLPAIYQWPEYPRQEEALVAYGPRQALIAQLVAAQADRVLRGARPGDLPILQPTTFELAINLKTAKALGLAVPQSLLARADEVIE